MAELGLAARRKKKRKVATRPGKGRWRAPAIDLAATHQGSALIRKDGQERSPGSLNSGRHKGRCRGTGAWLRARPGSRPQHCFTRPAGAKARTNLAGPNVDADLSSVPCFAAKGRVILGFRATLPPGAGCCCPAYPRSPDVSRIYLEGGGLRCVV
jgi:hypothetical protein